MFLLGGIKVILLNIVMKLQDEFICVFLGIICFVNDMTEGAFS